MLAITPVSTTCPMPSPAAMKLCLSMLYRAVLILTCKYKCPKKYLTIWSLYFISVAPICDFNHARAT